MVHWAKLNIWRCVAALILAAGGLVYLGAPVAAQNLFAPAARVQDQVITRFQVEQRRLFLSAIGGREVDSELALDRIINEKLQRAEARRLGVVLADGALEAGMDEFASRGNLTRPQFVAELANLGIAEETFRDFVEVGLLWRDTVRARLGGDQHITNADVEAALTLGDTQSIAATQVQVRLAEIFLPVRNPREDERAAAIIPQVQALRSFDDFSAAARQVSVAPSREVGGLVDWLPLANLPPELRVRIPEMSVGEISAPIPVPDAVGIFQFRGLADRPRTASVGGIVDYAQLTVSGRSSADALEEARDISERITICNDLYGVAKGRDNLQLLRDEVAADRLPNDLALALAPLDATERTVSQAGTGARIVMLCSRRTGELADGPELRTSLSNRRLQARADALLAKLRARAHIVILQ